MLPAPASGLTALLLKKFAFRHWRAAPRQSALLVVILALGISVFFSIRLANRAALASFQNFTDLITQESDWLITAPAGLLPESVLPELREHLGSQAVQIIPVLEQTAARPQRDPDAAVGTQETFEVLGVDLIGVQNFAARRLADRSWFGQTNDLPSGVRPSRAQRRSMGGSLAERPAAPGNSWIAAPADGRTPPDVYQSNRPATMTQGSDRFWDTLRNPRAIFITTALAARDRLGPGDPLTLVLNEHVVTLEVAGIIPASAEVPKAPATLLVMDLPALQALTGHPGSLSRIEFIVEPGPKVVQRRAGLKDRLATLGRERWLVSSPVDRRESAATMTRAFRINLSILSLLALLVGLYLIFQALDGAVVRRREEIGILRSLGVEEYLIRRAWLLEAALLGLAGGGIGALLGWAGAQLSVRLVGRTVNAIYYSTSVGYARLDAGELAGALALAVASSLLAGWLPAREAARTPPAQILVRHALAPPGSPLWHREWMGSIWAVIGLGLAFLPPLHFAGGVRFPLAGYVAGLCWIVGGGILSGWGLRLLARAARPLGQYQVAVRIPVGHLIQPSGRHRSAVAGLVCAIAMTAGMAILVASFDATMHDWIERTFQADLYVSSNGAQSASAQNRISPETWKALAANPAVADANEVQACEVQLAEGTAILSGTDLDVLHRRTRPAWMQPPLSDAVFAFSRNAGLALVSESFSERFGRRRGDRLMVPTPLGKKELTIAGVFSDYGNERGSIVVDRRHFADWFHDEQVGGLMVFVRPGVSAESLRAEWLARYPGLRVFSNNHLRAEILRVFRQTFAITYALEVIGVLVAVIGLGLTLASVLLGRRTELTTLRTLGLRRSEIAAATAGEGLALAVTGVTVGTTVSLALGWLLIYVLNKQTFGWTLGFAVPWRQLMVLALLVIGSGTAVAYGVGRWGAQLPADQEE